MMCENWLVKFTADSIAPRLLGQNANDDQTQNSLPGLRAVVSETRKLYAQHECVRIACKCKLEQLYHVKN